jgi:hypothetical protein
MNNWEDEKERPALKDDSLAGTYEPNFYGI